MNEQDLIERAARAKELIDNDLLQKALRLSRDEIIAKWEATPGSAVEEREWLWKLYHSSKMFEQILLGAIDSGKVAQNSLKKKNTNFGEKIRSIM